MMELRRTQIQRIALIVCLAAMWTLGAVAAPDIEFSDGLSFNFGDAQANTTLEHTFTFTNTGDRVLHIPRVKGG